VPEVSAKRAGSERLEVSLEKLTAAFLSVAKDLAAETTEATDTSTPDRGLVDDRPWQSAQQYPLLLEARGDKQGAQVPHGDSP
jgi:hypothetical protein